MLVPHALPHRLSRGLSPAGALALDALPHRLSAGALATAIFYMLHNSVYHVLVMRHIVEG